MQRARFWAEKNAESADFSVNMSDFVCVKGAVSDKIFSDCNKFFISFDSDLFSSIAIYYTILYYTAMPLIIKTSISDVIINSLSNSMSRFRLTCGKEK